MMRYAPAAACGLAGIALAVVARGTSYFPADLAITRAVQAAPLDALKVPMDAMNALGFVPTADIVYGAVLLLLFSVRLRWAAVSGAFALLGSAGVSHLCKALVARPRPPATLVHVEQMIAGIPTFPAGHVLNFTVLAGFLCWLARERMAPSAGRTVLIAVLLLLCALMGLARIHSGEHWASDVLGGYLFGFAWLGATIAFYRWGEARGFLQRKRSRIEQSAA